MKHATKSMLKSALVLFCAGLILTIGCFIFTAAKSIDLHSYEHKEPSMINNSETILNIISRSRTATVVAEPTDNQIAFTSIKINSQVGDIAILPTDSSSYIKYENVDVNNLYCQIKKDTLIIKEINPVTFMGLSIDDKGFSFDGLRQIFLSSNAHTNKTITLYLDEATLKHVYNIDINSTVGDVTLDRLKLSNCTINDTYGNVNFNNCNVSGQLLITGDVTDVKFKNNIYNKCNIEISAGGKINADAAGGIMTLKTSIGDINISINNVLENYGINLTTGLGTLFENSKALETDNFNQVKSNIDMITASTTVGDIYLTHNSAAPQSKTELPGENSETTESETNQTIENTNSPALKETQTSENINLTGASGIN